MKKLIFLLLTAVFLIGFVFAAETAYPPWDISHVAALSEYNMDSLVVTSDTVLVSAMPVTAELSSFQAVMVYNESAVQPQSVIMILNMSSNIIVDEPIINTSQTVDYWLRL